jgi:hypothetical protein
MLSRTGSATRFDWGSEVFTGARSGSQCQVTAVGRIGVLGVLRCPLFSEERTLNIRCVGGHLFEDTSESDTQSGHGLYDRSTISPKLQGKPALFEGKSL